MTEDQRHAVRLTFARMLADAGITITRDERDRIELAEFGLGRFELEGLGLIVYENNPRYCAKELIMLPGQTCPQHRHPPVPAANDPGKMETFRCRAGEVYLYLDGPATPSPRGVAPAGKAEYYTARREVRLRPGEQFTIPPDAWHWFQAGPAGAIVSEFSSTSRDELDVFADPAIRRV